MANLKSQATIKRHLKQLRQEAIKGDDPVLARIAYAMETAIRWATEGTVGWPGLADQARMEADLLREELARIAAPAPDGAGGEE